MRQLFAIRDFNVKTMRIIKFWFVIILLYGGKLYSQTVNFDSYNNVTDGNFKSFLTLFKKNDLPVSTNSIITSVNLRAIKSPALSEALVNRYLKENGELIMGALYNY